MKITAETPFATIPEWVIYADISASAVRLYCVLARFADDKTYKANPSRRKIAECMNVKSKDTVDRALKELIEIGAVTVKPQRTDHGDKTSNLYTLCVRPPSRKSAATPPQECGHGSRNDTATVAAEIVHKRNPIERNPIERELAPQKTPRKRGHEARLEIVKRNASDAHLKAMTNALGLDGIKGMTRKELGRLSEALMEISEAGGTPEQITLAAKRYRERWPHIDMTAQAIAGNWSTLVSEPRPASSTPPDRTFIPYDERDDWSA